MSEERRDGVPPRPDALHPAPPRDGTANDPTPTWGPLEALWVYLTALLTVALLATPFFGLFPDSSTARGLASIAVALAQAGVLLAWLRWRHPGAAAAIGLRAPERLRALLAGIRFGIVLYPATVLVAGTALQALLGFLTGGTVSPPQQIPSDLPPLGVAVFGVYAVVVAPFAEELFFRGILFSALEARRGFGVAALLSSLAFAAVHYVPAPWPDAVLLMAVMIPTGFGLAWIRSRRGSLYASIGAHLAFNVIGLALIAVFR